MLLNIKIMYTKWFFYRQSFIKKFNQNDLFGGVSVRVNYTGS